MAAKMKDFLPPGPTSIRLDKSIFTILSGTTIPDRAAVIRTECREGSRVIRTECREGSRVELRRHGSVDSVEAGIDVWLECKGILGIGKTWKMIGYVPDEVAVALPPDGDVSASVVGYGTVKSIYAPTDQDEAVVAVEIGPQSLG